jgi:hypothetical protein
MPRPTRAPAAVPTTGYSGTPLAKKLGVATGAQVLTLGAPTGYRDWLEPLPSGVQFTSKATRTTSLAHVFLTERADLVRQLGGLRKALGPDVPVWVSWPKKASKVPTTVTEDVIREVALPLGYVDVKVCAVSDVWSGLKLVVRKELRE